MRSGIACLVSFFYILILIIVVGCVALEDTADEVTVPDIIEHNGSLLAVIDKEEIEPPVCHASACYLQWVGVFTGSFSKPLSSTPTYNCNYGSGSIYYSTLYGDNQDGGATCSATSGYSGSLCDSYDSLTGKLYEMWQSQKRETGLDRR